MLGSELFRKCCRRFEDSLLFGYLEERIMDRWLDQCLFKIRPNCFTWKLHPKRIVMEFAYICIYNLLLCWDFFYWLASLVFRNLHWTSRHLAKSFTDWHLSDGIFSSVICNLSNTWIISLYFVRFERYTWQCECLWEATLER